jgi:hypothetical protein
MIVKPLKINIDNIDMDTVELFEDVRDSVLATGRVRAADVKRLFSAMFEDWTEADAGKVTRSELPQVMEAISGALSAVPLDDESA